MKILPDTYTIRARHFPALLSALPFFVIWFYLSDNVELKGLASFILNIKLFGIGGITFSIVFLYFYSLAIREISKYFQRQYFTGDKANGFPTTYLMTYADSTFSDSYKDKYRKLVSDQFDFELLNKEQEEENVVEARKRLNEAIGLIRPEVKEGYLVLQHNIWFGFCRNFIGGTIISMILCIVGILIGIFFVEDNKVLFFILGILFLLYLIVFLFRKPILVNNGEAYAKQLFSEFIGGKAENSC